MGRLLSATIFFVRFLVVRRFYTRGTCSRGRSVHGVWCVTGVHVFYRVHCVKVDPILRHFWVLTFCCSFDVAMWHILATVGDFLRKAVVVALTSDGYPHLSP